MKLNKRLRTHLAVSISLGIAFLLLILLLFKGLDYDQSKVPPQLVGKKAFNFESEWIQGQRFLPKAPKLGFSLRDLRGRPVILNFWASWCVSCRQEAAELEAFWQEKRGDDVLVVGIAIQDTKEAAQQFASYYNKSYILGLDANDKAAIEYGVTGVPETFLINRDGVIVHKEIGPVTEKMLQGLLPKIL